MSTRNVTFGGKQISKPGAYSQIKSGIKNGFLALPYGGLLIIDYGENASFGGGSGIAGTNKKNGSAVYHFESSADFKAFVKGGLYYFLSDLLFFPEDNVNGISYIDFVRAAATTPATSTITFTGGGANGGTIAFTTIDEGLIANTTATGSTVSKGYGYKMKAGVLDTAKFILSFYQGTYRGSDTNFASPAGDIDNITLANAQPLLLCETPEFSNMSELVTWMAEDGLFTQYFKAVITPAGTGAITNADLIANAGLKSFTGGTETYNGTHLNTALDNLYNNQASFILLGSWGTNAQSSNNLTIDTWNVNEARFQKSVYVAGGKTEDNFALGVTNGSIETAKYYNNQDTTVVHGGILKTLKGGSTKVYDSIVHAALALGREAGLEPQNPLTQKSMKVDGLVHILSEKQQTAAMKYGVLATFLDEDYDPAKNVILRGVNTLQNNTYLVNEDSTTASKQLRRIELQLNKELVINAKRSLFSNEKGLNRNTLNTGDVIAFTTSFLRSKVASKQEGGDNLILSFRNVQVEVRGTAYYISYEFVPNFEVEFLLFTGIMVDPTTV